MYKRQVVGLLWSGGIFEGSDFVTAFSASDASVGLGVGSIFALLITLGYYMARRVVSFKEFMECIPKGFSSMIPPILILTFAWSIKAMTDSLGAKEFVASIISGSASEFVNFLPVIIFVIAVFLAFATGTSWGTFGILIPIVVASFQDVYKRQIAYCVSYDTIERSLPAFKKLAEFYGLTK